MFELSAEECTQVAGGGNGQFGSGTRTEPDPGTSDGDSGGTIGSGG